MIAVAPFVLPAGRVATLAAHVDDALEAYEAAVAFVEGDPVPAGRYIVIGYLEDEYPWIPWGVL